MTRYKKKSDKLAWGITLLIFGGLILLDKTGIMDYLPNIISSFLKNPGTYFLSAGIVFLMYKREKLMGVVLSAIGVIFHSDLFFGWMKSYQNLMVPIALLVIGIILILSNKKR